MSEAEREVMQVGLLIGAMVLAIAINASVAPSALNSRLRFNPGLTARPMHCGPSGLKSLYYDLRIREIRQAAFPDNLSRPTDLGAGDVTSSPMGLAFLKMFVFPDLYGSPPPEVDWNSPQNELRNLLKRTSTTEYAEVFKKVQVATLVENEARDVCCLGGKPAPRFCGACYRLLERGSRPSTW